MRAVAESLPLTLRVGDMVAGEVGEEEEEDRKTGRRGGLGAGEQAKQKQKQSKAPLKPKKKAFSIREGMNRVPKICSPHASDGREAAPNIGGRGRYRFRIREREKKKTGSLCQIDDALSYAPFPPSPQTPSAALKKKLFVKKKE